MGRKPRIDRSPEEKWQIVQEGIKSGNVSETCRHHGIATNLFYRWKDEAEQGAKAEPGERSAAAAETEKDHRIRQLERTLGRKSLEIEAARQPGRSDLRRTDCRGVLGITHRRTAYHHPEGNSYIERFHRSLKEEEV